MEHTAAIHSHGHRHDHHGHEHHHEHHHEHRHEHHGGQRASGYPLAMAGEGQPGRIVAISGRDDTRRFLNNLGFVEGAEVSVVCSMGGDLIVDVKGARVALSQQMARRILVA